MLHPLVATLHEFHRLLIHVMPPRQLAPPPARPRWEASIESFSLLHVSQYFFARKKMEKELLETALSQYAFLPYCGPPVTPGHVLWSKDKCLGCNRTWLELADLADKHILLHRCLNWKFILPLWKISSLRFCQAYMDDVHAPGNPQTSLRLETFAIDAMCGLELA